MKYPATERLGTIWCAVMHDSPMWPIHGRYECRSCGRHYPVPWAEDKIVASRTRQSHVPSLRSVLLPLGIVAAVLLTLPLRAADAPTVDVSGGAALAFARYTAGLEHASPWDSETIEIEASLPKLAKHGRLRAIRHLLPFGKPEYQVLELAGDQTVKQQVIVRYLSAEVHAAAMPPASVAITPANYKFHYKGAVKIGDSLVYGFLITPRNKREGLIKGELWLDGETGVAVRQSGYLVKRPSIFVKRLDVTRETVLRDGVAGLRVTHVSVDTRLVGRAELTIEERPYLNVAER